MRRDFETKVSQRAMWLINLILNVAGLLLWLRWREKDARQLASRSQILMAATLKRTRPDQPRILFLAGLVVLLLLRSVLYWQLGEPLNWVPVVHFGVLPLAFRSDFFWRIFLFSFCSFAETLAVFYVTILLFSILNETGREPNAFQKVLANHLGWLDNLPTFAKIILPWLAAIALWCALSPLFVAAHILPARRAFTEVAIQGAALGVSVYLVWAYAIVGVLVCYLLNSYIYFGPWPFWEFIDITGRRLLKPLSFARFRIGKIDFAPVAAIAVTVALGFSLNWGVVWLYKQLPSASHPSPLIKKMPASPPRR